MGAVRPRACPSGQRVDAGWIRIPTQGLSAGASAVPTRRQDWTCESLWFTQQPWGIKGEKWEVQIVFLGRNHDVVMVTGYFRIQNLKATSSKPFFFFLFCGWSRPAGCRFEREHTLVIATKIFKFSQITLAEALSVDVAGHSLNRSRNIHTFAYSSNNFWNLLISLS